MSLFNNIKHILGGEARGRENPVLQFDSLGKWLQEREEAVEKRLDDETVDLRGDIRSAIQELKASLSGLKDEQHQEISPRMESVLRTAVPEFVAAMERALSRDVPDDDPETFYAAASSILVDVVRTIRTRGKYLPAAYPGTAGTMRSVSRRFGRAINEMTAAIHNAREEVDAIAECRDMCTTLERIRRDYDRTRRSLLESTDRLRRLNEEINAVESEEERLRSSPEFMDIIEKEEMLASAERRLKEAKEEYKRRAKTAAGLFRRGAKIAGDHGDQQGADRSRAAATLLESGSDFSEVKDAVRRGWGVLEELIDEGTLRVKKREERGLVRDNGPLPILLERLACRVASEEEAVTSLKEAVEGSEERRRWLEMEDAIAVLTRMKDDLLRSQVQQERRLERLEGEYRRILSHLRERLEDIAGDEIILQAPDLFENSGKDG
ncbi:MAG: hypothetical protein ACXQTN_02760 [Methanoculleaceae archaeon]